MLRIRAVFLPLALAIWTTAAFPQVSASLSGTVTDASGALISSATVKTTNTGTGISRSTVTDASGHYDLEALPLGGYEIRASKPGFADALRTGVSLEVAEAAVIDFSLKVGDTSQSVT